MAENCFKMEAILFDILQRSGKNVWGVVLVMPRMTAFHRLHLVVPRIHQQEVFGVLISGHQIRQEGSDYLKYLLSLVALVKLIPLERGCRADTFERARRRR